MNYSLNLDDVQENVAGFEALATLAYEEAGLVLSSQKAAMIKSRLRHRLRELNLSDLSSYCDHVRSDRSLQERRHMISALTTNVSDFFREPHHFDCLNKNVLPALVHRLKEGGKVRIWSAGCSRGQEPYSIAMLLLETDPVFATGDCKILATDIDREVLAFAADGEYDETQVSGLSNSRRDMFLDNPGYKDRAPKYRINQLVRGLITFKELNLIGEWPMRGKFDFIFCRNVLIYFDHETQDRLWPRFHDRLDENGMIYVGHSERINCSLFNTFGPTSYKPNSGQFRSLGPTCSKEC